MIQRIQSILLLLSSGCFLGQFGTSFATSSESHAGFLSDQQYSVLDHPVLMAMCGIGGLLAFGAIFLFKNRASQKRMSLISLIVAILFPAVTYWLLMTQSATMADSNIINDQLGTYLPFGSIVLSALAIFFIGKDDKLVKSMDRLR